MPFANAYYFDTCDAEIIFAMPGDFFAFSRGRMPLASIVTDFQRSDIRRKPNNTLGLVCFLDYYCCYCY